MKLIKIHPCLWVDPRKVVHVSAVSTDEDDDGVAIRWRVDVAFDKRVVDFYVDEDPRELIEHAVGWINAARSGVEPFR